MRARALAVAMLAGACVHSPPAIDGAPSAPPAPNELWRAPAAVVNATLRDTMAAPSRPSAVSYRSYTLPEIIDVALRNSPATRLSWAQARAAADVYGSAQSRYFPVITAGVAASNGQQLTTNGSTISHAQVGPTLGLTYTVLDFGGRSGAIDVARQTAVATDLSHNATVANTVLQVETAAFSYLSTRAERDAAQSSVDEASAALEAANERHRVGLATIADVLQAQTARSQAELQLETLEGSLQITRGGLAVAMGLPANTPFDVPQVSAVDSAHFVTQSVDSLIDAAVRNRPELAAARAQAAAASSDIRVARSSYLPALAITAGGASNASNLPAFAGQTYSVGVGFQMPIFSGFSNQYDVASASEQYQSALARAEATRQDVIQQVFTSYYTLRTATDRVRTSTDLLASATESEKVARERYKEGVGSIVDLLVAQSALATARAQEVDSRWQWRTALAQLAHDVGVLDARGDTTFSSVPAARGPGND